jgi:hypothetical protein
MRGRLMALSFNILLRPEAVEAVRAVAVEVLAV